MGWVWLSLKKPLLRKLLIRFNKLWVFSQVRDPFQSWEHNNGLQTPSPTIIVFPTVSNTLCRALVALPNFYKIIRSKMTELTNKIISCKRKQSLHQY